MRTLLDWYRAGEDVDRRMPLLSTYLGHVDPASTYWYLEAVPELLDAGRRAHGATARGAVMTALAPALQAFFTDRLITQRNSARGRSPPTATRSRCCCASRTTRPASSRSSWTSTTSTRR